MFGMLDTRMYEWKTRYACCMFGILDTRMVVCIQGFNLKYEYRSVEYRSVEYRSVEFRTDHSRTVQLAAAAACRVGSKLRCEWHPND